MSVKRVISVVPDVRIEFWDKSVRVTKDNNGECISSGVIYLNDMKQVEGLIKECITIGRAIQISKIKQAMMLD